MNQETDLTRIAANYAAERGDLRIQVSKIDGCNIVRKEEITEGGYHYAHNGMDVYILPNTTTVKAYWKNEAYFCTISGNITEKEMEQMIDSIA